MLTNNVLDTLKTINSKILYKEHHIDRTYEAFLHLKKDISRDQLEKIYNEIENKYPNENLRLVFSTEKLTHYEVQTYKAEELSVPVKLEVKTVHLPASQFKWENREQWQQLFQNKAKHADDVLIITENGFLRETCRFNVFVFDKENNCYLTPQLNTGCINGAFRRHCLLSGLNDLDVIEKNIAIHDLNKYEIFVGNSVRGILKSQPL